ncbi:MAG: hypothetical protein ACUVTZ_12825 [Armatimonadota bacterium]
MGRVLWELVLRDIKNLIRDRLLLAFVVLALPVCLLIGWESSTGPEAVGRVAAAVAVASGLLVSALRWRDWAHGYLWSLLSQPIDRSTLTLAITASAGIISAALAALLCGATSWAWRLPVRDGIQVWWYAAIGAGVVATVGTAVASRVPGEGFVLVAGLVGVVLLAPATSPTAWPQGTSVGWLVWADPAWVVALGAQTGVSPDGDGVSVPVVIALALMWIGGAVACAKSMGRG